MENVFMVYVNVSLQLDVICVYDIPEMGDGGGGHFCEMGNKSNIATYLDVSDGL